MVVPFGESEYYRARPEHRDSAAGRGDGRRARSRRLLRLQPAAAAAQAVLGSPRPRDRPRLRLARLDALALRRAGLHGDGHARREEHRGRLAEPLSAGARGRDGDAVPRRRAHAAAAAHAAGHGAGAGDEPDRAVRHPRRQAATRSSASFEAQYAAAADQRAERHRPRGVRRDEDAEGGRPGAVSARATAPSTRAAPFGQALKQIAQLTKADVGLEVAFADIGGWDTHVNQGGGAGSARRRGSTTSPAASPRSSPISATAWPTPSC